MKILKKNYKDSKCEISERERRNFLFFSNIEVVIGAHDEKTQKLIKKISIEKNSFLL